MFRPRKIHILTNDGKILSLPMIRFDDGYLCQFYRKRSGAPGDLYEFGRLCVKCANDDESFTHGFSFMLLFKTFQMRLRGMVFQQRRNTSDMVAPVQDEYFSHHQSFIGVTRSPKFTLHYQFIAENGNHNMLHRTYGKRGK